MCEQSSAAWPAYQLLDYHYKLVRNIVGFSNSWTPYTKSIDPTHKKILRYAKYSFQLPRNGNTENDICWQYNLIILLL